MAKRERNGALVVMMTAREKSIVREKADAKGMTMSSYVRWVLLAGEKKEFTQDGEL